MKGPPRSLKSKRVAIDLKQLHQLDPGGVFSFRRDSEALERDLRRLKGYESYMHIHLTNFRPMKLPSLAPQPPEAPEQSLERYRSCPKQRPTKVRYKTEEAPIPPPPKDYSKYNEMSFRVERPLKTCAGRDIESLSQPFDMNDVVQAHERGSVLCETKQSNQKNTVILKLRPMVSNQYSQRASPVKQLQVAPDLHRNFFTRVATSRPLAERTVESIAAKPLLLKKSRKKKNLELSPWNNPDQQSIF